MKILVTGGHLSPALAVIDELLAKKIETVFVGRKYNIDGEKTLSLEFKEITDRNVKFYHLKTGRFSRIISSKSLIALIKIPLGFVKAMQIVAWEKPDAVLSFGGYIGLPIAVAAFVFKIPVFIHEQTIHPGLANRITGIFAKKIFIAFDQSKRWFPPHKTILCGNPIRNTIHLIKQKPFKIANDIPTVYVTGGSLGSHSINVHIEKILRPLLSRYYVIHQTGNVKNYNDYQRLLDLKKRLPASLQNRYFLAEHFFDAGIGYVYSLADLVISRAGANTFFELLSLKKPAILIPLPWSAHGEQTEHALLFQSWGLGKVFYQSQSSENLLAMIHDVMKKKANFLKNFEHLKMKYKKNAAQTIVRKII